MPNLSSPAKAPPGAFLEAPSTGGRASLDYTVISLGRNSQSLVDFGDNCYVSRFHAELRYDRGRWSIVDAGSLNGIFVNGSRVAHHQLVHNDEIVMGHVRLRFLSTQTQEKSEGDIRQAPSRYRVISQVGGGAEAVIFRAELDGYDQDVAIKVPRMDAQDRKATERFHNELAVVTRLRHPNLVFAVEHGQWKDGRPFFAMPFYERGSIRKFMFAGDSMPEEDARQVGSQIASALDHLHQHGYVHQDTKPENMLIGGDGNCVLGDFGITIRKGTRLGGIGTPHYMAPEQFQRGTAQPQTDLYGLGCSLYEMVAGRCPFEGREEDISRGHITERPPRLGQVARVSPALDELVGALLEKNPMHRPVSGHEVSRHLLGA